jgi:hypothetical protein
MEEMATPRGGVEKERKEDEMLPTVALYLQDTVRSTVNNKC